MPGKRDKRDARHVRRERNKKNHTLLIVLTATIIVILLVVILALFVGKAPKGDNTALIRIEGIILTQKSGFTPWDITTSDSIVSQIKSATKNDNIKAIIFEINSPGGSAVASSEIADAVLEAKSKGKLTIAVIRETGASGAYWIASSCDYIFANSMSITGSIGVIASYLEISGLLSRYNVTYEQLTSGEYKDIMSPFRPLTAEEKRLVQERLDLIYQEFINNVAENRNLTVSETEELATGIFYLGSQAKESGLIDQIGNRDDAIDYIKDELGITVKLKEYKTERSLFSSFLLIDEFAFWIGRGIGFSLTDQNLAFESIKIKT